MSDINAVNKKTRFHYITSFVQKEIVLVIAFFVAAVSMIFVHPSREYFNYMDWKVLACLFSLMIVVAGLRKTGIFDIAAVMLTRYAINIRSISAILILITFFISMAVTNDVALITFVPFALLLLHNVDNPRTRITVITLQTIAANIGSSLTPFGNPQNLYLFSYYHITPSGFFFAIGPVVLSGGLLLAASLLVIPKTRYSSTHGGANHEISNHHIIIYLSLFLLSVLAVFRIFDYRIVTAVVAVVVLIFDRRLFSRIDYSLLFTFVGFFIFIGNLQQIESVNRFLTGVLGKNVLFVSVLTSQAISNVPAAILLSRFTSDVGSILRGVSIGGMGTIIASLASVISFKFFVHERPKESMRYLLIFTIWNILFLVFLYISCILFYGK